MNKDQTRLALQLVALLGEDLQGQANAKTYGNWLEHLTDQLTDELIDRKGWGHVIS